MDCKADIYDIYILYMIPYGGLLINCLHCLPGYMFLGVSTGPSHMISEPNIPKISNAFSPPLHELAI